MPLRSEAVDAGKKATRSAKNLNSNASRASAPSYSPSVEYTRALTRKQKLENEPATLPLRSQAQSGKDIPAVITDATTMSSRPKSADSWDSWDDIISRENSRRASANVTNAPQLQHPNATLHGTALAVDTTNSQSNNNANGHDNEDGSDWDSDPVSEPPSLVAAVGSANPRRDGQESKLSQHAGEVEQEVSSENNSATADPLAIASKLQGPEPSISTAALLDNDTDDSFDIKPTQRVSRQPKKDKKKEKKRKKSKKWRGSKASPASPYGEQVSSDDEALAGRAISSNDRLSSTATRAAWRESEGDGKDSVRRPETTGKEETEEDLQDIPRKGSSGPHKTSRKKPFFGLLSSSSSGGKKRAGTNAASTLHTASAKHPSTSQELSTATVPARGPGVQETAPMLQHNALPAPQHQSQHSHAHRTTLETHHNLGPVDALHSRGVDDEDRCLKPVEDHKQEVLPFANLSYDVPLKARTYRDTSTMDAVGARTVQSSRMVIAGAFSALRTGVDVLIALFLEALTFIFYVLRGLIVESLSVLADVLLKPLLHGIYNGIIHPIFFFLLKFSRNFGELLGAFFSWFEPLVSYSERILRAFRLVEVTSQHPQAHQASILPTSHPHAH